MLATPHHMKW